MDLIPHKPHIVHDDTHDECEALQAALFAEGNAERQRVIVLAARVEALERERDGYKRQADVRIALEPAPHVHQFAWSSTFGNWTSEVPPDAMCVCGITYAASKQHVAAAPAPPAERPT